MASGAGSRATIAHFSTTISSSCSSSSSSGTRRPEHEELAVLIVRRVADGDGIRGRHLPDEIVEGIGATAKTAALHVPHRLAHDHWEADGGEGEGGREGEREKRERERKKERERERERES